MTYLFGEFEEKITVQKLQFLIVLYLPFKECDGIPRSSSVFLEYVGKPYEFYRKSWRPILHPSLCEKCGGTSLGVFCVAVPIVSLGVTSKYQDLRRSTL